MSGPSMRRVLAVHPDADLLDLMAAAIQERLPDLIVECVRNAAAAEQQCRAQREDPFHLVIANYSIAPDYKTPRKESEYRGLDLLKSLEALGHGAAATILIASAWSNDLQTRVNGLPNCRVFVMEHSVGFEEDFVQAVRGALDRADGAAETEEAGQVKVVVSLNLKQRLWEYELKGAYATQRTALQIDTLSLERLVNRSKRIERNDSDWEEELLEIGQDLGKALFDDNPPFLRVLKEAENRVGGADKKSICFTVEKSVHPAVLEALTDSDQRSFWMLKVPIYRRLIRSAQEPLQRSALFKGRGRRPERFRALIIESPAEGVVDGLTNKKGRPLTLNPLAHVKEEADAVEALLLPWAEKPLKRIGPDDVPPGSSLWGEVQKVLSEGRWDLVHYAGHSYYDEEKEKGYIFFPGEFVEKVDVEMFNSHLDRAQTRFAYLSGCQSSETGFVFELARLQIPAVLGFRWPINDDAALRFASGFYEKLFGNAAPCLEKAFLATRCAMRDKLKQDKIWASAMLILQDPD